MVDSASPRRSESLQPQSSSSAQHVLPGSGVESLSIRRISLRCDEARALNAASSRPAFVVFVGLVTGICSLLEVRGTSGFDALRTICLSNHRRQYRYATLSMASCGTDAAVAIPALRGAAASRTA